MAAVVLPTNPGELAREQSPNRCDRMMLTQCIFDNGHPETCRCLCYSNFRLKNPPEYSVLELWNFDEAVIRNLTDEEIVATVNTVKISPVTGRAARLICFFTQ